MDLVTVALSSCYWRREIGFAPVVRYSLCDIRKYTTTFMACELNLLAGFDEISTNSEFPSSAALRRVNRLIFLSYPHIHNSLHHITNFNPKVRCRTQVHLLAFLLSRIWQSEGVVQNIMRSEFRKFLQSRSQGRKVRITYRKLRIDNQQEIGCFRVVSGPPPAKIFVFP
jgi:hypothetical protein